MIPKRMLLFTLPLLLVILWGILQVYINTKVENIIIKNEIEIEGTIKDAIKKSKESNPTNNPHVSLDGLRSTLSNWD